MALKDTLHRLLRWGGGDAAREHESTASEEPTLSVADLGGEPDGSLPDPSEPSAAIARGSRLGRYVVLRAIGAGGSANVYAAYDPDLDRRVALKLLRIDPERGRRGPQRLLREAQAAARLSHPNVITVYDVGMVGDRPFVAMELVDGETLDHWWSGARGSWRQVLKVLIEAGRGLAAAHEAGVVHRDFKPSNVMVARDGRVLVLDFGLALAPHRRNRPDPLPSEQSARARPAVAGTPGYLAPELERDAPADERSDQFAFCVTAWQALHRRSPFPRRRSSSTAAVGEPTVTKGIRVPGQARRALERGLAADPEDRFPSMRALLQSLEAALRSGPRWIAAGAIATTAVAALTGLALEQRRASGAAASCVEAGVLTGAWDPSIASEARTAFATVGGEPALSVWPRIERRLDDYAIEWSRLHRHACEATHLRREQSSRMLDLQMACLDTRWRELATISDMLRRPDPALVVRAIPLVESLSPLARCGDRAALLASPPPPADRETANHIALLRSRLAEAKVLEAAGRYGEAISASQWVLDAAQGVAYPPVEVDALLRLAQVQGRTGQFAEMRRNLLAAAERGDASGYDEAVGLAFTLLAIAETESGDLDAARTWVLLAGGAVARTGDDGELAAIHQFALGRLADAEGRHEESIDHHVRFLEISRGVVSIPRPVGEAYARLNLGRQYVQLERFDAAEAELRRALDLFKPALGPDHPAVARTLGQLGELRSRQGDPAGAVELYGRALAILESSGQEANWMTADFLEGLAAALEDLDRVAEANNAIERSRAIRRLVTGSATERAKRDTGR